MPRRTAGEVRECELKVTGSSRHPDDLDDGAPSVFDGRRSRQQLVPQEPPQLCSEGLIGVGRKKLTHHNLMITTITS